MQISPLVRWCLGIGIALMLVAAPYVYYRKSYATNKRLRVASAGRVYRSGCMTAEGFRNAIKKHGIRTVINLQNEATDPDLPLSYFSSSRVKESELCRELGVAFHYLLVDLVHPTELAVKRPATIDRFLELMDDESTYPVLIHCKAGLHRTGCLVALYRMEYQGWSKDDALRELKAHGFGEWKSTAANDYIAQYILNHQPRRRGRDGAPSPAASPPATHAIPVGRASASQPTAAEAPSNVD